MRDANIAMRDRGQMTPLGEAAWSVVVALVSLIAAGCGDSAADDGTGGRGTGAHGGTGGGVGGAAGTGGSPGGGGAGTGATGGMTGTGGFFAGALTDRGLLTRYYIDQAAEGQGPTELADSAPSPMDLPIVYGPEMNWTELPTGRGLAYAVQAADGRASAAVAGSKVFDGLHGSTTGTIEVVADVENAISNASRLSHIGFGEEAGHFTLTSKTGGRLRAVVNSNDAGTYPVDLVATGRAVMHVVLDTTQAQQSERIKVYVNGTRLLQDDNSSFVSQSETINLSGTPHYTIGNRHIGGRTIQGGIYYAALYSAAFTDEEVFDAAGVLIQNDDAPE